MSPSSYWLVSLPLDKKRKDNAWELLQEKTQNLSQNSKFEIPELRVGTLDTLMHLSDDLSKTSSLVEMVVNKLRRQVHELGGPVSASQLRVKGLAPDTYITRFKWNEAKYQAKRPLRELVDLITESVGRIEDDLKVKVSEYNTVKGTMSAAARKLGGSLAVRDLHTLVKPNQIISSENMTTAFVVVSKFAIKDWEGSYEKMCNFVVPRSSKLILEEGDYALLSVVLFRRVLDDFKAACRSRGFQLRDYKAPSEEEGGADSASQNEQLKRDVEAKKTALEQWSKTAFEEVFSSWVHIVAIRLFVESILRYGLPPAYQAAVIAPQDKSTAKLRQVLNSAFGGGKSELWSDDVGSSFAGLAGDSDMHSYVSYTIAME